MEGPVIAAVAEAGRHLFDILFWGLAATVTMTTIMYGSQSLGLSRLSLPFLLGTFVSGNRYRANILGFVLYVLGGWIFAFLYVIGFFALDTATWWLGGLVGLVHGLFLLAVMLPLAPYIHPRLASEYDGPTARRVVEPPGFLGLNYGYRTPLTTLVAQVAYGVILGAFIEVG